MIRRALRRIWSGHGPAARVGGLLLAPATMAYRAGLALNRRRIAARGVFPAGVPVIIVGNLTVGGTGKTPLVAWLARELVRMGRRPAIISRGYGGRRTVDPAVVSDGRRLRLAPAAAGDEPVLLATELRGVPVVVGRDRVAAAGLAIGRLRANVVILDDGFQQRARFPGALRLVTVNGRSPFGNGRLLPAGPLREPRGALAEADGLIVTRGRLDRDAARAVGRAAPRTPRVSADLRLTGLVDVSSGRARPVSWLTGRRVLALSAIGDPDGFSRTLAGAIRRPVAARLDFRDHHRFTRLDIARARRAAAAAQCAAIVITEKDAVKWPGGPGGRIPVLVARAELRFNPAARSTLRGWVRTGVSGGSR